MGSLYFVFSKKSRVSKIFLYFIGKNFEISDIRRCVMMLLLLEDFFKCREFANIESLALKHEKGGLFL
jgi:hypothetical protein